MKLAEILSKLDSYTDDDVVVAKGESEAWTDETEMLVKPFDPGYQIPNDVLDQGFHYFLEINVIREVLEGGGPTGNADLPEQCRCVLYYAKFDAFPPNR